MKFAILILPAVAMLAFAQEPAVSRLVRLESVTAEVTQGEVFIYLDTSAPLASPGSVVIEDDSLVWNVPGVSSEESGKHLSVNQNGVRDIFVSLQQRTPPSTRVTIRLSRLRPFIVSADATRITLKIGAAATKARARQVQGGPIPAARGGTIDRIFRRAPKQQAYDSAQRSQDSSTLQGDAPSATLPPIRLPDTSEVTQASATTLSEAPTSASNPSFSQVQDAPAKTPVLQRIEPNAAGGTQKNTGPLVPATRTPRPGEQLLPFDRSAPSEFLAANIPERTPAPEFAAASVQPVVPAPSPVPELRLPAIPNPDLRTVFHVKFVQQDAAYIDAGRNQGIAEGMKLLVVNADPNGTLPNNTSPTAAMAELTVVGIAETSAVTEIHVLQRNVVPGDLAYLSDTDLQALYNNIL